MSRASLFATITLLLLPALAAAHTGERVYLQLLPTGWYLAGGALVVALTFALTAWLPPTGVQRIAAARLALFTFTPPVLPGALVLGFVALLAVAGWSGSRDPLDNPLPTVVWSVWWAGFTVLHAALGNLWSWLAPWPALHGLLTAPSHLRFLREAPPFRYPRRLAHWPAVATLAAFAWLELVYPAPQDPARLATVMLAYVAGTGAGMLLFGRDAWLGHAEAFSVFFRMVARVAPFASEPVEGEPGRRRLLLRWPGAGLLEGGPPRAALTVFVLLALSTVSFDGLSRTFTYVAAIGHNPLEFPGRTALVEVNTTGLAATFAALAGLYALAVVAGLALAGVRGTTTTALRALAVSIIPIAFGYHVAHYLPYLLIDAQYAARALGDPLALGWNLLGLRDLHVHAAFLSGHENTQRIWNAQVVAIVGAHAVAVVVAHAIVHRLGIEGRAALVSQAPMTLLMVAYTLLGLWLLSTPAVG